MGWRYRQREMVRVGEAERCRVRKSEDQRPGLLLLMKAIKKSKIEYRDVKIKLNTLQLN